MIFASRSVKYPFGRNFVLVLDGATGIMKNEATTHQRLATGSWPLVTRLCPDNRRPRDNRLLRATRRNRALTANQQREQSLEQ